MREKLTIKSDGMGIAKLSGTDNHGMAWTQFEVDYLAEETDGTCSACQDEISHGCLCLDDSEELCNECLDFEAVKYQKPPKREVFLLQFFISAERLRQLFQFVIICVDRYL